MSPRLSSPFQNLPKAMLHDTEHQVRASAKLNGHPPQQRRYEDAPVGENQEGQATGSSLAHKPTRVCVHRFSGRPSTDAAVGNPDYPGPTALPPPEGTCSVDKAVNPPGEP